jgi:MoxR-like ATPase
VRDAFRHRIVLSYQALAEEVTADQVLDEVLGALAPPQLELGRTAPAAA